ncbi:hypothetical protein O9H85_18165 [Paenibacillus filicis]|uniref:Uncharacterized protein n=1 Tax=Paenibacillus gyeongsangnamensis TaxID=3388067 RepID=A0ABT4QBS0_9BACL|nr:hypothetical protein [Paenibacillus filicis]MCZ8514316.1 hypothetical protein [Paenibacillus filicis]
MVIYCKKCHTSNEDKKAKAAADAKAKEEEKAKNPTWNVKVLLATQNGNVPLAVKMLVGDVSENGQDAATGDVLKTPWNYYGRPVKFSGTIGILHGYPPGSDFEKRGILSQEEGKQPQLAVVTNKLE